MPDWQTRTLAPAADVAAPDGSEVRLLAEIERGSMAHFKLMPGQVSKAVAHRTVQELWYIAAGQGRMWRSFDGVDEVVELHAGVSLSIPAGARFQFRCDGDRPLEAVGVTMPPWPGAEEAYDVEGAWPTTL
ncbi:MAG: cupin domain-containing protein [Alphaproteobacteria bacterium]